MNYRFKLDKEDYDINYSELAFSLGGPILRWSTSYIYFPDASEKAITHDYTRKEIYTSLRSQITRNWAAGIFVRQDLDEQRPISRGGSITYEDECSRFTFSAEKEYSENPDDENAGTSFYFTFFLKTLGGVGRDN